MKIIEYWEIMAWDGGDRHVKTGISFASEEEANRYLETRNHDYAQRHRTEAFDTLDEYESIRSGKVREEALAKLTDLEKRALGLSS